MTVKEKLNECIETIKFNQSGADTETEHYEADSALCDFLEFLGYEEIVEEWIKVPKWYA